MATNDLLQTTDAQAWAHEFCEMFVVLKRADDNPAVLEDTDDEGLMIAWFANAIETAKRVGYEQGYETGQRETSHALMGLDR